MLFPILFTVVVLAVVILLMKLAGADRNKDGNGEALGIRTVKLKGAVQFVMAFPVQMTLVLELNNGWRQTLARTALFPQPCSGDEAFDELFSLTAYRDDAVDAVRNNAGLRTSLMQLFRDLPSISAMGIYDGKLTLTLGSEALSKDYDLDSAREAFVGIAQGLRDAFAYLAPDSAGQARARKLDTWASAIAWIFLFALMMAGAIYGQPVATDEIPWRLTLSGDAIFLAVQIALLLAMTTQGIPRMKAMGFALFASLLCMLIAMPQVVTAVNARTPVAVITETVQLEQLYQVKPRKGLPSYYMVLAEAPQRLSAASRNNGPTLTLSGAIYTALENETVRKGSRIEVAEAIGYLGLPFVVRAEPL